MVRKQIQKLKSKKAPDREGWTNEMLKKGGKEMEQSIISMFTRIHNELEIPQQWDTMKIKSLYKNKGSRSDMKNRRGLFLTSIISKLFEKVMLRKSEENINIDICQSGGKKGRSITDNWLALTAVLDNNRRMNKKTYLLLADAEKCFDKLWLKDCLIDINSSGMREREVALLFQLNKSAKIQIETPAGTTEDLAVKEIVKQGKIFGPVLCCANSVKVNNMESKSVTNITPTLSIQALAYVDDIMGAGSKDHVESAGKNLQEMEWRKKYTFNNGNGKSHYMIIQTGREKEEKPEVTVEKGSVTQAIEYKYLGQYISQEGTIEKQLTYVESKVMGMIAEMERIAGEGKVGYLSTQVKLMLFEKTIIPSIIYNLETWNYWRVKDWEHLERIQAKALKRILKLPVSTPYWGILNEIAMWDMRSRIVYKRLMLYHNISHSENERLGKKIIEQQKEYQVEGSWYTETAKMAAEYDVDINKVEENISKSEWKKLVKDKIEKRMIKVSNCKKETMSKLKVQRKQPFERQKYLEEKGITQASEIIKTKLSMWDIGNNLGITNRQCAACNKENETLEHIVACEEIEQFMGENVKTDIILQDTVESKVKLSSFIKQYIKLRDIKEKVSQCIAL